MSQNRGRQPSSPNSDLLEIDRTLSDEQRLLRDTVRRFVQTKVLPDIGRNFEQARFDRSLIGELAQLGVFGMQLSGYGCAGADAVSYGLACRELEAGDSSLRSFVSVQGSLVMFPIWKYGSPQQREQWLPDLAAGRKIGCFGLTEPDAGSDPSSMRTTAKRVGGKGSGGKGSGGKGSAAKRSGADWVLNGTKLWITNGTIADVALVWAQTEDETGRGGVRGFLVPTDAPGFSARNIERKLSMRASITSELVLEDVRVPESMRLPEAEGMRAALSCLSEARFGIIFGAVGAARACFEAACEYAGQREQFARPIAAFQLTQAKLADMLTWLTNSSLVAMQLARLKDDGSLTPAQISYGKRHNVAAALEVARTARGVLGANGISLDYPVMRHMANLESVITYEGTHEVHTLVLGQELTGHSAFSG